ncbi:hypothetical protein WG66_007324 [Moniliophthora roreri]|nr:hypothetical protein WG66_007324 [Moniliophthora roreri]
MCLRPTVTKTDTREEYYTKLEFNGGKQFRLDSVEHCFLLESSFHSLWDKYGLFCILPELDTLGWLCEKLEEANERWQQETTGESETRRPSYAYEEVKYIQDVGLSVLILDSENFAPSQGVHLFKIDEHYEPYIVSPQAPYLVQAKLPPGKAEVLPPLKFNGEFSLFALIVNAYSKIMHIQTD